MGTHSSEGDTLTSKLGIWTKGINIAGTTTLFGALLYFVGRRYIESYLTIIGVPPESLNLNFSDYVYSGAHPIRLAIVILFTLVGIGLYRILTFHRDESIIANNKIENNKTDAKHKRMSKILDSIHRWNEKLFFSYITLLFLVYSFSLPIIALIEIFGGKPDPSKPPVLALISIILLYFTVGWAVAAFFDKKTLSMITHFKAIRNFCIWGGMITFFLLPYLGTGAYGTFIGAYDISKVRIHEVFDTAIITTAKPLDSNISWVKTGDGLYQNKDTVYLLVSTENDIFVKLYDRLNLTIRIPKSQLNSLVIERH
jgi:hypothetical protein